MFKLVALCLFAAVVAEPQVLLYDTPLSYGAYPAVIPATTTITRQSSVIAQPSSPIIYSHLIKKRSADPEPEAKPDPQLLTYGSPLWGPTVVPNTLTAPVINPLYPGLTTYPYETALPYATHLIKKRSAQVIAYPPATYEPTVYGLPSYPYYANNVPAATVGTVVLGQHLIKKRDAVLPVTNPYLGNYNWPATIYGNGYSPLVSSLPYVASPYVASPYAYPTYIKK